MRAVLNAAPLMIVFSDHVPDSGEWEINDLVKNTVPLSHESFGWICVTAGVASNVPWSVSTFYGTGQQVNANGNVYECILAGTSGVTAPSGTGAEIVDGHAKWKYVGALAVFREFGLISTL